MRTALLVDFFTRVPNRLRHSGAHLALGRYEEERKDGSDPGRASPPRPQVPDRNRSTAALDSFRKRVLEKYTEGTLLRLLESEDVRARRAAVFSLGLLGEMEHVNGPLAQRLQDQDAEVQKLAAEALWGLWFSAATPLQSGQLRRLVKMRDREQALAGLTRLIAEAPLFAEAYNQRAILYFKAREFDKAVADCLKAIELNPHHFGAQGGLGQCYLQMRKHAAALKAFRAALRINPRLDGVAAAVEALEKKLGEEGH